MAGNPVSQDARTLISAEPLISKKILAWALYDWANSAFALSVLAALFPLVLGDYWSEPGNGAAVTARLGWITFAANAVVCISAPFFGAIADAGGYRKRFLTVLAVVGAIMTAALGFVGEGNWQLALAFYLFASIGFYTATLFYDSLLVDVTVPRNYNFVSTLGFSAGYLGGALLLALHVWMLKSPQTFGLSSAREAFSYAFVSVGIWWLVFTQPLLFSVPEKKSATAVPSGAIRAAYAELRATLGEIRKYRNVVIFLSAYLLYVGGLFTVIFMAANFGQRLGFASEDLVAALAIANAAGFPATLLFGVIAHRAGARNGIYLTLVVYVFACLWALQMSTVREFYVMAVVIGCVQGGAQALSRSLYASLIPTHQPGEFFGFYSMVRKLAHVIGPGVVAVTATVSDDPKWVMLALIPLFVGGGILLSMVKITPRAAAESN